MKAVRAATIIKASVLALHNMVPNRTVLTSGTIRIIIRARRAVRTP